MKTNNQIQQAFFAILKTANIGYPYSIPGKSFTPPGVGNWLEPRFIPNQGIDEGLPYNSSVIPIGIFQVDVYGRKGPGEAAKLENITTQLHSLFSRGTTITTPVRVSRAPYNMTLIEADDKIFIPVSIPYAG